MTDQTQHPRDLDIALEPHPMEEPANTIIRPPEPEPDRSSIMRKRAIEHVSNIGDEARLVVSDGLDELRNLQARLDNAHRTLSDFITKYSELSMEVIVTGRKIIGEAKRVSAPFGIDPPATITSNTEESSK